jgi:hypothetical protein
MDRIHIVGVAVIATAVLVSVVSYAFLIPLDSVPAVAGVSILFGVAYGISFLLWTIVMRYYATQSTTSMLDMLNTHILFLVVIPATIAATAMNVTSIQNTRNLLAGKISA